MAQPHEFSPSTRFYDGFGSASRTVSRTTASASLPFPPGCEVQTVEEYPVNRSTPRPIRDVILSSLLLLLATAIGCSGSSPGVGELISTDLVVGEGKESVSGKRVSVHYTGWLYDPSRERNRGAKFDSSHDRGLPFTFTPGRGGVIAGWSQGVPGMKVGGVRELIIPPDLAYGDTGAARGLIPANATLVFEIELVNVRD